MDEALVAAVRQRAAGQCEYCQLSDRVHPGPFEIEHVISTQHGGATLLSNLAYSCLHCNRHKGPNLAGLARIRNTTSPKATYLLKSSVNRSKGGKVSRFEIAGMRTSGIRAIIRRNSAVETGDV